MAAFAPRACFVRADTGVWDAAVLPEWERPCVPGGAWLCVFARAEVMQELLLGGARGEKRGGRLEIPLARGAPMRSTSAWARARSAYWAGLAFSQHPRTPHRYLVHVRCKQCLPDLTSVNVDLPVTRWETRESGSEGLLSSYPSRTHLTRCQTLK